MTPVYANNVFKEVIDQGIVEVIQSKKQEDQSNNINYWPMKVLVIAFAKLWEPVLKVTWCSCRNVCI